MRRKFASRASSLRAAATLMFSVFPALIAPQGPLATADPQPARVADAPVPNLGRAINLAADYLERACDVSGRFAYRVDTNSGRLSSQYNVVRHAGAIYELGMFDTFHPDQEAVSAMMRAAAFLRTNYIGPDERSNTLVVWSKPLPTKSDADLGAAGLGLVALASDEQAQPKTMPLEQLRALGRFVIFLEKSDGSFASKYRADTGPVGDWQSLYYPGEAALGLIALYELDHSNEWLAAAGEALSYLAISREGTRDLPPDHWALIATAKFLPYYDRIPCRASRAQLMAHAIRISRSFLREQITNAPDARLDGGFEPTGRTTPTATRLEGLLATLEFLPPSEADLRTQIEVAVQNGIAFLLRAQISSGPYAGGMPQTVLDASSNPQNEEHGSDVRIDYVQHALSAWLRYQHLHPDS